MKLTIGWLKKLKVQQNRTRGAPYSWSNRYVNSLGWQSLLVTTTRASGPITFLSSTWIYLSVPLKTSSNSKYPPRSARPSISPSTKTNSSREWSLTRSNPMFTSRTRIKWIRNSCSSRGKTSRGLKALRNWDRQVAKRRKFEAKWL